MATKPLINVDGQTKEYNYDLEALQIISNSKPTTRLNGSTLQDGDLWFKPTDNGIPGTAGWWIRSGIYWISRGEYASVNAPVSDTAVAINGYCGIYLKEAVLSGVLSSSSPNWNSSNYTYISSITTGIGGVNIAPNQAIANDLTGVSGVNVYRVFPLNIAAPTSPHSQGKNGILWINIRSVGTPTGGSFGSSLRYGFIYHHIHP